MKNVVFIVCFFMLSFLCSAQESKPVTVSGEFRNISLIEFFKQIESQTPCFFYYDFLQVDSVFITLVIKEELLQQALEKALKNTDLQFAVDRDYRVFITKGIKLVATLPVIFFTDKTGPYSDGGIKDTVVDYGLQQKKKGKVTSVNKLYEIGSRTNLLKGNATISGNIRNAKTGEALVNASVFINNTYSTTTDAYGYYSLTVPAGKHNLNIQAIGMVMVKWMLIFLSR